MSEAQTIIASTPQNLPPMLKLYCDYKLQYQDCLILMQVGDFYEAFFEDAVQISKILNLTLTSRDKSSSDPIPMAGIPVSVLEPYLDRLLDAGCSALVVSQSGSGKNVERYVDRIVTPGVRLFGKAERNDSFESLVAAIYPSNLDANLNQEIALVILNSQAGKITCYELINFDNLFQTIHNLLPKEIILPVDLAGIKLDRRLKWLRNLEQIANLKFRSNRATYRSFTDIQGFSALSPNLQKATKLAVTYLDEIAVGRQFELKIEDSQADRFLSIDARTRTNLEVIKNQKDHTTRGSLYEWIDFTSSCLGARLLNTWLREPSKELDLIHSRQQAVGQFLEQAFARSEVRKLLKDLADLERIISRIELQVAVPRELGALRDCLRKIPTIKKCINDLSADLIQNLNQKIDFDHNILDLLEQYLSEHLPLSIKDGGIIKDNFNVELDRLRDLKRNAGSYLNAMEISEREQTGINSLKVKFNNLHGYFIEITKTHLAKVPEHYIKKQSTVNSDKFTTAKLKEIESEILSASDKELKLEKELFDNLLQELKVFTKVLRPVASGLAELDVILGLSQAAEQYHLVCPDVDASQDLIVIQGQHPVISKYLGAGFIPNDLDLSTYSGAILTGPNMGGKSTYLRQNALIIILAQIGSYVPAEKVKLGIVDHLFARIGASDDLHEGESTFMVEMRETSYILSRATNRSFILIDELGRGTATEDGVAIAQAVLEHILFNIRARFLFATHYYQLTDLPKRFAQVCNLSVGSEEFNSELVFNHQIISGAASRSYGIEVARMAGLPPTVLNAARDIINLSNTQQTGNQLSLPLTLNPSQASDPVITELIQKIKDLNCDELTPKLALDFIYAAKDKITS